MSSLTSVDIRNFDSFCLLLFFFCLSFALLLWHLIYFMKRGIFDVVINNGFVFSIELIVIRNEPGPLGIHVVPDYDRLGKDRGLVVQGIEPGGRIDRDGKLAIYDRIIEINGQNLLNQPFQR